jgi:hypothetical protein
MYISPVHTMPPLKQDIADWSVEQMIEVFQAQIDGWHLGIADRIINEVWKIGDDYCINAINNDGDLVHYVVDSGWAVLQITLSYFEIIAFYKNFAKMKKASARAKFDWGFKDVFPELAQQTRVMNIVRNELRNALYHTGLEPGYVYITHDSDPNPIVLHNAIGRVRVDPHSFVQHLRSHFKVYIDQLKDVSMTDLRNEFQAVFKSKRAAKK